MQPAFREVCRSPQCIETMGQTCEKILLCGHFCCGFKDEMKCLPCLNEECVKKNEQLTFAENSDSYCTICYTEGLGQSPCVQLECRHIFHFQCLINKVKARWNTPRINFSFMECPTCKNHLKADYCPELEKELQAPRELYENIEKKALERADIEGLKNDERFAKEPFNSNMKKFSLFALTFFECF